LQSSKAEAGVRAARVGFCGCPVMGQGGTVFSSSVIYITQVQVSGIVARVFLYNRPESFLCPGVFPLFIVEFSQKGFSPFQP